MDLEDEKIFIRKSSNSEEGPLIIEDEKISVGNLRTPKRFEDLWSSHPQPYEKGLGFIRSSKNADAFFSSFRSYDLQDLDDEKISAGNLRNPKKSIRTSRTRRIAKQFFEPFFL